MVKVAQAAFAMAYFWGLSDAHECSGCPQMAPYPIDKQTADHNSPHDWLMSLAMDLAALCDMWRWKSHQWMPFVCFSEDIAFAHHFMATHPPPSSHPVGILVVSVKNYRKWWAYQLAIHSIVDEYIDYIK